MNSGKFFRLNLEDSKIVDKVAIYDYIDLPAYKETPNGISPKYPITLCITQDSLRFSLHYCAFHEENKEEKKDIFYYDIADYEGIGSLEMVHLQEVILEIPFTNNSMQPVSDSIKDLYINYFPVFNKEKKDDSQFLKLKLDEVYKEGDDAKHRLDHSFSNLWLMGTLKDHEQYVGFLRKLLLDFMFDLKHTEVFQTAASYQEMYSGLMSDFYFSALMHKCEYYYYRGLTLDAISSVEKLPASSEIEENKKKERKKFIRQLYATKLFEAEKAWVEDITNPLAERCFKENDDDFLSSYEETMLDRVKRWFNEIFNELFRTSKFITRPNWFADPEEEMRRVCFTMKESGTSIKHLCNSETVAEYLGVEKQDGVMDLRSQISRWFLRKNAFSDVLHLHLFRFAHYLVPVLVLFVAGWILSPGSTFFSQDWWGSNINHGWWLVGPWVFSLMVAIITWVNPRLWFPDTRDIEVLTVWRARLVAKRTFWWVLLVGVGLLLLFVAINAAPQYNKLALRVAFWSAIAILMLSWTDIIHIKLVKNVHLLLPRLVASIAAAWLTLAIGNELFQSFFDALPSRLTCGLLSSVVLFFILYEMNKSIPNKSGLVKLIRSIEMLVASYLVSIVVGLFIINFTGERFMERSGYLETFHSEYLANNGDSAKFVYNQDYYYKEGALSKDSLNRDYLNDLENLTITRHGAEESSCGPVITYWEVQVGDETHRFFVLRDFLIQFAFLAMFIGVFIQMIFEEKSITDM